MVSDQSENFKLSIDYCALSYSIERSQYEKNKSTTGKLFDRHSPGTPGEWFNEMQDRNSIGLVAGGET
jgi:hypothetical protein